MIYASSLFPFTSYLSKMFRSRIFFFTLIFLAGYNSVEAQSTDFCEAVTAILRDAPNQFRNVHGSLKESNSAASIFKTNIIVPGTINSRFVSSMGLFYEGAIFQTRDKNALRSVYEQYKARLDTCLSAQGFNMRTTNTFYAEIEEFKKVIYMVNFKPDDDIKKLPGHVTLEVDYNKERGAYTLSFYIFEH